MKGATLVAARAAKGRAARLFRGVGEVVGVGLVTLDGGYGVKVNLAEQPVSGTSIPTHIGKVPLRVEVVGTIRKQ